MLPELVLTAIRAHRPTGTPVILLACSGGIDSQVLSHSAARIWPASALVLAHVHHGLRPEADDWLAFCREQAQGLGGVFLARHLPALHQRRDGGIEAWARRLRYQALADMAAEAGADLILTAHHANDQVETYRLQRLRGAGPLGLGAMRSAAPLPGAPRYLLLRPFLGVTRQQILDYAKAHQLAWVEDPSNQDQRLARNRVRRELEQVLSADPSDLQRSLAEIDAFQRQADVARQQARLDLSACRMTLTRPHDHWSDPTGAPLPQDGMYLSRTALAGLPRDRAGETIRLWLEELGCRMPSRARLEEIMRQLIAARGARAQFHHDGRWLLRYRDRIDAAAVLPVPVTPVWFRWSGEPFLEVAGQQFLFHRRRAVRDRDSPAGMYLLMDRGRGSDRLRLSAEGQRRTWKNLCQERGIAPWMRPALPVLRLGDEILYAAPFGLNHGIATGGHGGVGIEWVVPPLWARWL